MYVDPAAVLAERSWGWLSQAVPGPDYEVDFITFFTQLANTGAKFNPDAYLKPIDSVITRL